mgnify:CR=1 FL=1
MNGSILYGLIIVIIVLLSLYFKAKNKKIVQQAEAQENKIDVTKPVENPLLVKALDEIKINPSEDNQKKLFNILNDSVFLCLTEIDDNDVIKTDDL